MKNILTLYITEHTSDDLCLSWGKFVALWENLKIHLLNLVFPSWNPRDIKDSFARGNINLAIPNKDFGIKHVCESLLCHWIMVWPCDSSWMPLNTILFIHKIRTIMIPVLYYVEIKWNHVFQKYEPFDYWWQSGRRSLLLYFAFYIMN